MIKYIKQEVAKIKNYPDFVIKFMLEEENWIELDPDCTLGENHLLSYPDQIFVLNLDNAKEDVHNFFEQYPNEKLHKKLIENFALDEDLLLEDLDEIIEEDLNTNCVFAYVYPDTGEEDIVNGDLFPDGNHVYIYNGLDENEDYEQEDFAEKTLNVFNIELF